MLSELAFAFGNASGTGAFTPASWTVICEVGDLEIKTDAYI